MGAAVNEDSTPRTTIISTRIYRGKKTDTRLIAIRALRIKPHHDRSRLKSADTRPEL